MASSVKVAPRPNPPKPQYSFTSFQVNNPTAPLPGDKLDSEYARQARVISDVIAWVGTSLNSDGSLKAQPKSDPTPVAGADGTALASDYATLAGAWAEHMPDTIPPNILAFMDVTGDHWSSRWWANQAAQAVQYPGYGDPIVIDGSTSPANLPQGTFGQICIRNTSGQSITIYLPSYPILPGQSLNFKDALGNAGTYHITISALTILTDSAGNILTDSHGNILTAGGGRIDGVTTYVLTSNYAHVEVFWMGDQWGTR